MGRATAPTGQGGNDPSCHGSSRCSRPVACPPAGPLLAGPQRDRGLRRFEGSGAISFQRKRTVEEPRSRWLVISTRYLRGCPVISGWSASNLRIARSLSPSLQYTSSTTRQSSVGGVGPAGILQDCHHIRAPRISTAPTAGWARSGTTHMRRPRMTHKPPGGREQRSGSIGRGAPSATGDHCRK